MVSGALPLKENFASALQKHVSIEKPETHDTPRHTPKKHISLPSDLPDWPVFLKDIVHLFRTDLVRQILDEKNAVHLRRKTSLNTNQPNQEKALDTTTRAQILTFGFLPARAAISKSRND